MRVRYGLLLAGVIALGLAGSALADEATPGKPWQRPGSTVRKAVLCDGVTDSGQPRNPGQRFRSRDRVIVLWLEVDPHNLSTDYEVVWSRGNKEILRKSFSSVWPMRRLMTMVPANAARHQPGAYQVEIREEKLAVYRIPFIVEDTP